MSPSGSRNTRFNNVYANLKLDTPGSGPSFTRVSKTLASVGGERKGEGLAGLVTPKQGALSPTSKNGTGQFFNNNSVLNASGGTSATNNAGATMGRNGTPG